MKSKVGVTGASGFIGKHLIHRLLQNNYPVSVLAHSDYTYHSDTEVIRGNLLNPQSISTFIKKSDIIIHLAGRQLPPNNAFFRDNVVATTNLMDCLLKSTVKQVVFLSTIAVYGDQRNVKHNESEHCSPTTYYGYTKYLAEKSLQYWETTKEGKLTVFRPFNVYGENSTKGVVFNILRKIKDNEAVTIYGDGSQTRDFLHVSDVVDAIMMAIEKSYSGIVNLGTGNKISILELVKIFEKMLPNEVKIKYEKSELGKTNDIEYSIHKAQKELGWNAHVNLEEGIRNLVQ